ncbi:MAG: hypothetical protein H6721_09250 [Sandaracinus sp.]|nr:hypothetical protein [Sandaracinus sp.]
MSFDDETYATWVSWASDDASVPAIRRFLEDGAPVDELLRDPAIVHFSQRHSDSIR